MWPMLACDFHSPLWLHQIAPEANYNCNNNKQMSIQSAACISFCKISSKIYLVQFSHWKKMETRRNTILASKQKSTVELVLDAIQNVISQQREIIFFLFSFQFMSLTSVHLLNIDSLRRKLCIHFSVDFVFLVFFFCLFRFAIDGCRRFTLAKIQYLCDFFRFLFCQRFTLNACTK